jgi:hypothetical protein
MNYKLLLLGIILGIILSILIYFIYTYFYLPNSLWSKSKVGVTKNYLLDEIVSIPISNYKLSNFAANRFSIEIWLFINPKTLPGGNTDLTNIFKIGEKISLDLYNDTSLKVKFGTTTPTTITPSFFLQKWQQVIISVDQYLLDVYLDGKLMKSIKNLNTITIPIDTDIIQFNQKIDTYISGCNVKTIAMNPKTALENYKVGKSKVNGTTKVSLALSKNENVTKNLYFF